MTIPDYIAFGVLLVLMPWGVRWLFATFGARYGHESSGGGVEMTFKRIIVWPGGREEVEATTPKQLPAPSSHTLPNSVDNTDEPSETKT